MVYFRSCPRCSDDRSLEEDHYGWYLICLPCGYVSYPEVVGTPDRPTVRAVQAGSGHMSTVSVLFQGRAGDVDAVGAIPG